jgi:hypothetical protein
MPRRTNPKCKPPDPRLIERLERAKKIAENENCRARNVAEFETLPCSMIADFLDAGEGLLSDVVVENAWKKFLREAGDPDDPIERMMLFQLFTLHYRVIPMYSYLGNGGHAGYRFVGPVAAKMTKSMIAISSMLKDWREKRQAGGVEQTSRTKLDADPEAEQEKLLSEHRERQRRHWRIAKARQDEEAAAELAAMTSEQRAAREEKERRDQEALENFQQIKSIHGIEAARAWVIEERRIPDDEEEPLDEAPVAEEEMVYCHA